MPASDRQWTNGPGQRVARPKRLARLAMGVGSVANGSSDSPRPSYLRACHPVWVDFKLPLAPYGPCGRLAVLRACFTWIVVL